MTENKRYVFDEMNGGGYVVGYSERMGDGKSLIFTRLCEVPNETQAENVCNELKGLQKENEQLKSDRHRFEEESKLECTAQMSRVFDLIDKKIKKADEYFKQSYDSWYQGQIDALKELKKELQE